ncbi:butyrophilin subfamily 1 member A1-like [Clinocottus analis]|uniref:butyrophilin subfamily 1 member A1-like n=1 Tax=Clinocottus analis TaxID=304258 RepID=UPI0035C1957F
MDWALIVVLQVMIQPSLSALFTVEAEQTTYEAKFGEDVVMGCRFQPKLSNPKAVLKVTWHWISSLSSAREVYRMDDWKENLASRDPDYRGRVRLLTEELQEGRAKIQVSGLRINDSGTYQCLVLTEEGADYKTIRLSVVAPYEAVTKCIQKEDEEDEALLTCQSQGYPKSSVVWQDGHLQRLTSNTSSVSSADQRFTVTSQIRVRSSDKNNYTCVFTNDGNSATFHIPDEILVPRVKNDALIVALSIGVIMVVIIIAVLMYRRQKGSRAHRTRNHLVNGRGSPAAVINCLEKDKDEEVIRVFNEVSMEENLAVFLKAHYCDFSISSEARHQWEAFAVEELPHRLRNNKGQPVNLQALLPEAGETLFLEGAPGSGKTTVAHILVSSWTEGSTHALANLLDLSTLPLLFLVDCSKVKGDLFQEMTIQLSLMEKISTEDELRTVLTESSEALLLLDGYREGNQLFDESLRKLLREKGGCGVLVTACPGHCPTLKDIVETEKVLQLQTV